MHESMRVDRQLRGRSGRQGDPGSSQFFVSLEDNLMRLFGSDRIARMMDRVGHEEGEVIQHSMISKSIERAQKKVEENNFGIRKNLLEYDDVMNQQREVIYKRRKHALFGERLKLDIANSFYDLTEALVEDYQQTKDYEGFKLDMIGGLHIESPVTEEEFFKENAAQIVEKVYSAAYKHYASKIELTKKMAFPIIKNEFEHNTKNGGGAHLSEEFSSRNYFRGAVTQKICVRMRRGHTQKSVCTCMRRGHTCVLCAQKRQQRV